MMQTLGTWGNHVTLINHVIGAGSGWFAIDVAFAGWLVVTVEGYVLQLGLHLGGHCGEVITVARWSL